MILQIMVCFSRDFQEAIAGKPPALILHLSSGLRRKNCTLKLSVNWLNLLWNLSEVKNFDRKTCGDDGAPTKTNEKKI